MVSEPSDGAVSFRFTLHYEGFDEHRQLMVRQRDGKWCVGQ
jgi:hypothetical protein